jgi:hypothetical protein
MGLDASIMCDCFRLGKTAPCPFPDQFYMDEDGYPALRLDKYDPTYDEKSDAFDQWLATCCEHPFMEKLRLPVVSWKGYAAFTTALHQRGEQHFPTLLAELPDSNVGLTQVPAVQKCLSELADFQQRTDIAQVVLLDTDSQAIVGIAGDPEDKQFDVVSRSGLRLGLDAVGFHILDAWEHNRELFRAMRFEQIRLETTQLDEWDQFQLTDLDTGRVFLSSTPVRVYQRLDFDITLVYPRQMRVETRQVGAEQFAFVVDPLFKVFLTAIEVGNPVRWC